jgi:hypothetical protein
MFMLAPRLLLIALLNAFGHEQLSEQDKQKFQQMLDRLNPDQIDKIERMYEIIISTPTNGTSTMQQYGELIVAAPWPQISIL